MRRLLLTLAAVALLAGCGVAPTGVDDGGDAPTGLAAGPTLYYVDAAGELAPQPRATGRLGTISEALALLLAGPAGEGVTTQIDPVDVTRVQVTIHDDVIALRVPLAQEQTTPLGVDQIVCTAIAVYVQGGGSTEARVRVLFTIADPGADAPRRCPLIP
jgi:hypothetical protein